MKYIKLFEAGINDIINFKQKLYFYIKYFFIKYSMTTSQKELDDLKLNGDVLINLTKLKLNISPNSKIENNALIITIITPQELFYKNTSSSYKTNDIYIQVKKMKDDYFMITFFCDFYGVNHWYRFDQLSTVKKVLNKLIQLMELYKSI